MFRLPLAGDGRCHGGGIEEYTKEGEGGRWAFLLQFCWRAKSMAKKIHGVHVSCTFLGVGWTGREEVIQVVDDVGQAVIVAEYPPIRWQ